MSGWTLWAVLTVGLIAVMWLGLWLLVRGAEPDPFDTPPAPRGVRLSLRDGTVVPADLAIYHGRNREGLALWEVLLPERVELEDVVDLRADYMPARSMLVVALPPADLAGT
jgi:hypothetical protein